MRVHLGKSIFIFLGGFVALILCIFILRFVLGGDEDSWICKNGQWVKHGNPSYTKPTVSCNGKQPLPKNEKECQKIGGVWKKLGPDPFESCNIKTADRGNICTDNSECEGWCQVDMSREELREGMKGKISKGRGRCSIWRVELGCFGMVEKGKISVICID